MVRSTEKGLVIQRSRIWGLEGGSTRPDLDLPILNSVFALPDALAHPVPGRVCRGGLAG